MSKTYHVSDLFFTRWKDLPPKVHAIVYTLQQECEHARTVEGEDGQPNVQYGIKLIKVLRHLRKRKLLVDKINVSQAVDIYNDLTFLREPWYHFPSLPHPWAKTPADKMARHTFDHFIYADNEFSSFVATQKTVHLNRLAATLYQDNFDKEAVEDLSKSKFNGLTLLIILWTFAHVRQFVVRRCKTLLPPAPASEQSKPAATGRMWLQLKHRLAETPAFQGYDNTGRANMYSALDYLEDLAKQKEEKRA